ncbi:MAG: universal stress protein [Pseudomonadota bacterium]
MFKGIKTILFPTDLSKNCIPAFDFATLLSLQFQSKIVFLHVKEKIPDYIEGRLEGLLGEDQWQGIIDSHDNTIRQKLIGKRSSSKLIQMALEHLCEGNGSGDGACQSKEIVISDGDAPVADIIIETLKAHDCDLIVMGANRGVLSKQSVSGTLKSVMKHSEVPVVVVPYSHKIETD